MSRKKRYADRSTMQNAAMTLLANIRFASVDDPIRSIVVTSSVPNEGKTSVSVELARAMAQSGCRVLLVEADMRKRSLATHLGARARYGVYSVLAGQVPLQSAVTRTSQANLDFLDAEPHIPNPPDILASSSYARLIEQMKATYNYIIFDAPPVGTFVDAAVLATLVDGTVFVVRERHARRTELADAYEQLRKAGANVIGVVMNCCKVESNDYYYAYYNQEGKRVKKKKSGSGSGPQPAPMVPPAQASAQAQARPQTPMQTQVRVPQGAAQATAQTQAAQTAAQARQDAGAHGAHHRR